MLRRRVMSKKVKVATKNRTLTEAKLIDAAELVFAQVGFEGATTRMIALKAGTNLSLINRYFDGKYGLLIALIKKKSELLTSSELGYPRQKHIEAELVHYCEFLLSIYFKEINFLKVCISQFLSDQKFLKKYRDTLLNNDFNPEIVERLEHLTPKKDVQKILLDIDNFVLGIFIRRFLISGIDAEETQCSCKEFIQRYSKHLESSDKTRTSPSSSPRS